MSNQDTPRFELYRRLRYQHQIRLTPNAMDTIEQFYHQNIKGSIYHVGMYRAINIVFSVITLVGIIIFWNHLKLIQWFIAGMMVLFLVYNAIHLLINVVQYKRTPEPKPFDKMKTNPESDE